MPVNPKLHSGFSDKVSLFNKKAADHQEKQLDNPFSEWGTSCPRRRLSRDDSNYGRPVEGSKTAERGRKAEKQLQIAIRECCEVIFDCGERLPDGTAFISFGRLFHIYNSISDKCVGLLMRARKHGLVDFEGEMLFQRRDDDVIISLRLPINAIRHQFGFGPMEGGGKVPEDEREEEIAQALSADSAVVKALPVSQLELDAIKEGSLGEEKLSDDDDDDEGDDSDDFRLLSSEFSPPSHSDITASPNETPVPIVSSGEEINNRNEALPSLHSLVALTEADELSESNANPPAVDATPPQKFDLKETDPHERSQQNPIFPTEPSIDESVNSSDLSLSTPFDKDENITTQPENESQKSEDFPFLNSAASSAVCYSTTERSQDQPERVLADFPEETEKLPEMENRKAEATEKNLVMSCPTIDSQVTLLAEASPQVNSSDLVDDSPRSGNELGQEAAIEKLAPRNENDSSDSVTFAEVDDFKVFVEPEGTPN